jgi:hypothetical protein
MGQRHDLRRPAGHGHPQMLAEPRCASESASRATIDSPGKPQSKLAHASTRTESMQRRWHELASADPQRFSKQGVAGMAAQG